MKDITRFKMRRRLQLLTVCGVASMTAAVAVPHTMADDATSRCATKENRKESNQPSSEAAKFVRQAQASSLKEIQLAELARQKSDNREVQQFAQDLKQDFTQANQELRQIAYDKNIDLQPGYAVSHRNGSWADYDSGTVQSPSEQMRPPADAEVRDRQQRDRPLARTGSSEYTTTENNPETTSSADATARSQREREEWSRQHPEAHTDSSTYSARDKSDAANSNQINKNQREREQHNQREFARNQSTPDQMSQMRPPANADMRDRDQTDRQGNNVVKGRDAYPTRSPSDLSREDHRTVERFRTMSGQQFDREFVSQVVKDQKKAIDTFEKAARNLQDTELKQFAQERLDALRDHQRRAQEIAGKVGMPSNATALR